MNTSLRDQLLKAGLVNKKQANEADRQQQRQERRPAPKGKAVVPPVRQVAQVAQSAKVARDLALNQRQQEKAEKKARLAQIKQLIEQNRLPTVENGEFFNFVDESKIRRIAVDTTMRERLSRREIAIVRHEGRYDLVPAAIAARIRERSADAVIDFDSGGAKENPQVDDAYSSFSVPDDLIW
jgi:uncharacterized protein YaiL (DUF2058 family)